MNYFAIVVATALFVMTWVLYWVKGISLDTAVITNMIFIMLFPVYMEFAIDEDDEDKN